MNKITEAISLEADLLLKLKPLSEVEIFDFMKNLRGGTYFNMGMYSYIPVSRAYKKTLRIYKVINMTAVVSGVSYENIGTTKDFRDKTGKGPSGAWYDHMPGYENKVGVKKSDPSSKYVLWDIKEGSSNWVRYYVVDIATGAVTPVSKDDVKNSGYLTDSEKAKLEARPSTGFDLTTGAVVENKTNWRTAAFEHIFWLSQSGRDFGTKFTESLRMRRRRALKESADTDPFRDAHAGVATDLDALLSGSLGESIDEVMATPVEKPIPMKENANSDIFTDKHAGVKTKLDDILSGTVSESKKIKESYRRTVSRGKSLTDNELFVDFD